MRHVGRDHVTQRQIAGCFSAQCLVSLSLINKAALWKERPSHTAPSLQFTKAQGLKKRRQPATNKNLKKNQEKKLLTGMASDPSSPAVEEGVEDEEDDVDVNLEEAENGTTGKMHSPRGTLLTRRGITLRVLLKDRVIQPGEGLLTIHYLGKTFVGDLLPDGKIRWQETSQIFNSPSAWATHCKKLVNPAKKSGCGWASVKYKGQKLDQYKTMWLRKQQPPLQAVEMNLASEEDDEIPEEEDFENHSKKIPKSDNQVKKVEEKSKKLQAKSSQDCSLMDNGHSIIKARNKDLGPVQYSVIGSRDPGRDPHTLVELTSFTSVNKFQPFNVAISSNVLLLVDFHCHLTTSEVVGYLGGRWDTSTQLLTILRAFPCRIRLSDKDSASAVEEEICQNLFLRGLSLVGWYHSHPYTPALPSLQDIDSQMEYQLKLQGTTNSFQPCLALICGPYHQGSTDLESKIAPFWVLPPPEQKPNDYGIPMEVEMTYVQDTFLTSDVLHEMMLLLEYYKTAPDIVKFKDKWNEETTYLEKVKGSLANKTPKDQTFVKVLEHIYNQLSACS
ncbi:LOW QUALITY PROTEIN: MPN domain-containing protein [Rhincodon typus]|uniref:LOW QUALITY PROTEIN: MPN domain-containing protein n=1 Tax=Rhincodon typus TaxID=259920 RepID=UPI00202FAD2F|nr:LOW QUALITY PROTEIN: MPN domain-containing protein [Rhincodon typus]